MTIPRINLVQVAAHFLEQCFAHLPLSTEQSITSDPDHDPEYEEFSELVGDTMLVTFVTPPGWSKGMYLACVRMGLLQMLSDNPNLDTPAMRAAIDKIR